MSKHLLADIRVPIEQNNPSIMGHEKHCIKCGQCKQVYQDMIGVKGRYQMWKTGDTAIRVHCGQYADVCPVGYVMEVPEWQKVQKAIDDKDSVVISSTSPSIRVALGESFEMEPGSFIQDKMVTLLRVLGADYVLDANFSAGLAIMKEANELIHRIQSDNIPIPQLASCCPAWVKFVKTFYPEFKENLSTSKSPIGIQGPTIKTHFAKRQGLDPRRIVNVAVTPCTVKKSGIRREEMCDAGKRLGIPEIWDMGYVITTRRLAEWAKPRGIDFTGLKLKRYDSLIGEASGTDVIFGNTDGVMEAAVHTAYTVLAGEPIPENLLRLETVHGMEGIREASLVVNGIKLDIAVVYGTANVKIPLDKIKTGGKFCQFIEVIACPGGCIDGDGQSKNILADGDRIGGKRISGLYRENEGMELRLPHKNPGIIQVYDEFYEASESKKTERVLYIVHIDRSGDLNQQ